MLFAADATSQPYPGDVSFALRCCKSSIRNTYSDLSIEDPQNIEKKLKRLSKAIAFDDNSHLKRSSNGEVFFDAGGTDMISIKELPPKISSCAAEADTPVKESARHVIKEATAASMMVIEQLEQRPPDTSLLEALCLVTPRFRVQMHLQYADNDRKKMHEVDKQLGFIIKQFGERMNADGDDVAPLVDKELLNSQFMHFYSFMSTYTIDLLQRLKNDATVDEDLVGKQDVINQLDGAEVERLWRQPAIPQNTSEYTRLAHLILSIPCGSVENERRFSAMNMTSTAIRNRLEHEHLNTCLRVASSPFTDLDFPFWTVFQEWKNSAERRGVGI